MKKTFISLVLLLFTTITHAKYGIGFSFKDFERDIYFHLQINEKITVEPFISYFERKNTNIDRNIQFETNDRYSTKVIGIGITKNIKNNSIINTYSGVRVAYIEQGYNDNQIYSNVTNNDPYPSGYRIEPLLGFEYSLTNNLKLAFEAKVRYDKVDQNSHSTFNAGTESERKNFYYEEHREISTNTSFLIRYFF